MRIYKLWLACLLMAIVTALLFKEKVFLIHLEKALLAPHAEAMLGTDSLGRDLLARICFGAAVSLAVGLGAMAIATSLGLLIGAVSGYKGGVVDEVCMRILDIALAFPTYFLILALVAWLGSSLWNTILLIGMTSWMTTARLVRARVLTLKNQPFILAAKGYGASGLRIFCKHFVPHMSVVILIQALLVLSQAILVESALSFLGLGISPPIPSWGNLLAEAKGTLGVGWWLFLFPGLAIFLTVYSAQELGEELKKKMEA